MNKKYELRALAVAIGLGGMAGWWLYGPTAQGIEQSSRDEHIEPFAEGAPTKVENTRSSLDNSELPNSGTSTLETGTVPSVRVAKGFAARTPTVPATIREAAGTFRHGQNNAFFDEVAFARSLSDHDGQGIESLRKELRSTDVLESLPENVNFFKDAPEDVLDRMAMIDMLGLLAKENTNALDVLIEVATSPLDASLPPHVIQALVGEKYDAFVELARNDWKAASSAFSALSNDKLKDAMRPALMGGLVDSGTPNEEAQRMVEAI